MHPVNTLLFDLDGTLLDRQNSLLVYLHRQLERRTDLLANVDPKRYLDRVIELDAHGHTPKDEVFQQVEREFGLTPGAWRPLYDDFWRHFPDTAVPFQHMHPTLYALKDHGMKMGIVTNGSKASQLPKINGLGLWNYCSVVLISELEGVKKPHPEIFQRALNQLGSVPERTFFIGDNPEADIRGAQALGIRAIWKRDPYWEEPDYADGVIDDLSEIFMFLQ